MTARNHPVARVATYNIRHGRGADGEVDLDRTAATILQTGADVIALQEVDRGVRRSGGLDQLARLQTLTGLSIRFSATTSFGGGEFGLALASTKPLELEFRSLPQTGFDRPHGVIVGRRAGITIAATHLSRRHITRAVELAYLAWWARRLLRPVVVMGDLNGSPGRAFLRSACLRQQLGSRPTFPSRHPRRQIDHILTGPELRVVRSWTIESSASDHLPVVAEIELPDESGQAQPRR